MEKEEKISLAMKQLATRMSVDQEAQSIYLLWPSLERAASRLCNFISPMVLDENGSQLAQNAISNAINAYLAEEEDMKKASAYLDALLETAAMIGDLRIYGIRNDKQIVWEQFIEPMNTWIERNKITSLVIEPLKNAPPRRIAKDAIRAHILTAQDMLGVGML